MRFTNFCLLFCYFVINVIAYRKLDIQQNQEKYEKYVKCLEDRLKVTQKLGIRRPFTALIFPRGASIKLSCFECLSPEAESDIEELWKPTDSFIGRAIRVLKDKVRKTVRKLAPDAENEGPEKVSFRWEYQPPMQGAEWTPAIDLHEPKGLAAKAAKVISGFMSKDKSTVEIGDHYELEVVKANHSLHTGFYRCLRVGQRRQVIEAAYFVDVVTDAVAEVAAETDEAANTKAEGEFITDVNDEAEAVWRSSPWSECNVCGDGEGEQRRRIECVVQPKPNASIEKLATSNLHFL
uniref:SH3 domain-containing protein n=1 Tax=Panagrellus redivivus TaxID=6233 RepID=A0A7E4ZWR0_PANRE